MAKARSRQPRAQLLLRMDPAERERIRAGFPHGSLNAAAVELLLKHADEQARNRQSLPLEDSAA